jgi:hypothetical protein
VITFSLAHLTVLGLPPPEMVRVAARTGYRYVGLRLIAVTDTSPGYALSFSCSTDLTISQ